MHRTTVMLPRELKERAAREARSRGVSLGELIREALASRLSDPSDDPLIADREICATTRTSPAVSIAIIVLFILIAFSFRVRFNRAGGWG